VNPQSLSLTLSGIKELGLASFAFDTLIEDKDDMSKSVKGRTTDPVRSIPDLPSPVPQHVLDAQITPERAARYRQILMRRTGRLAVVIEDCHDPHNATAITRSCDAFGVNRVHAVVGETPFSVNRRVSGGSHHHVDLRTHVDIEEAYAELRSDGFAIAVSALTDDALCGPQQLIPILDERPLALVFGNEHAGASEYAEAEADYRFLIPMVGFAQSINVSVSVAITLYTLRQQELASAEAGDLTDEEQRRLYDEWIRRYRGEAGVKYLRRLGRGDEPLDVYTVDGE